MMAEGGGFWDKEITIGEVEQGRNSFVVVKLVEKNGRRFGDVRKWFVNDQQEERPTQKGVAIPVEALEDFHVLVGELLEAYQHEERVRAEAEANNGNNNNKKNKRKSNRKTTTNKKYGEGEER